MEHLLKRVIYGILVLLCGGIFIGTYGCLETTYLYQAAPLGAYALLTLSVLLMLGFCLLGFRMLGRMSEKKIRLASAGMGIVMLLIFAWMLLTFRVAQASDSHNMLDMALYLSSDAKLPISDSLPYSAYFGCYSNQYFLSICLSYYAKLLSFFHIQDKLLPYYLLNLLSVATGTLFTWLLAFRCKGSLFAARVMLLCVFNPVYYCMMFWIYSNEMSVCLLMAVLYFGVRMYQVKEVKEEIGCAAAEALVTVTGYFIRPTGMIPFIALAMCAGILLFKHRDIWKKLLRCSLVFLGVSALLYAGISKLNQTYYRSVSDENYPITHWLMMGSHNNGRWNPEDEYFTRSYTTKEEKQKATLEKTLENYQALGVGGTLQLFATKMIITWSDGMSEIESRCAQDTRMNSVYPLIFGEQNDCFKLYAYCYRGATMLLILLAAIQGLREPKGESFRFLLALTLFGAILFYMLWEAKESYSIPFLMVMSLLAALGGEWLTVKWTYAFAAAPEMVALQSKNIPQKENKQLWKRLYPVLAFLLLLASSIVAVTLYPIYCGSHVQHKNYTLYSNNANFSYTVDWADRDGSEIIQEFYTRKEINKIALRAIQTGSKTDISDCIYRIALLNAEGQLIDEAITSAAERNKSNNTLYVSLCKPATKHTEKYYLQITKLGGTVAPLHFVHRAALYLDHYKGECTVDGTTQSYDLFMSVYQEYEAPYYSPWLAFGLLALLPLMSGALMFLMRDSHTNIDTNLPR